MLITRLYVFVVCKVPTSQSIILASLNIPGSATVASPCLATSMYPGWETRGQHGDMAVQPALVLT